MRHMGGTAAALHSVPAVGEFAFDLTFFLLRYFVCRSLKNVAFVGLAKGLADALYLPGFKPSKLRLGRQVQHVGSVRVNGAEAERLKMPSKA